MENAKDHSSNYNKIVLTLIAVFIVALSIICSRRYYSFDYIDMDLAAYNQIIWNLVHGSLYSSILGLNFLGHHAHFILFLFAPIYFFFQSPLTLIFLQIFFLAIAAYPIFLIAKEELNPLFGLIFVIAYLLYPAMGYTVLYEFHVTVFATAFLSFMFYFYVKQKFKFFIIFMVLSLLTQENIALVIVPFGIFAFIKKRSMKWWLIPIAAGGAWFLIVVGKIMPYLNKDTVQFVSIYRHMGNSLPEVVIFILSHPLAVLKMMLSSEKLEFLAKLFGPLCFLPLFDGAIFISGLLFVQHLLSVRSPEYMIEYHYDAEILPFIFISAIYALKRVMSISLVKLYLRPLIIGAFLLTVTITCAVSFGPFIEIAVDKSKMRKDIWDIQKERFLKMIPDDASIVATFEFLPRLSSRKEVYSFHHIVNGFYTLSSKPYVLPLNVEYALLDVNDPIGVNAFYKKGRSEKNLQKFIYNNNWGIVESVNNIVLFKKDYESNLNLFEVIDPGMLNDSRINSVFARVKTDIMFIGFSKGKTERIDKSEVVEFKFYYKALREMDNDYRMLIEIVDEQDGIVYEIIRPLCYRVFPSYMWQKDAIIKENYSLLIPSGILDKKFNVNIKLVDSDSDKPVSLHVNKPGAEAIIKEKITILTNR